MAPPSVEQLFDWGPQALPSLNRRRRLVQAYTEDIIPMTFLQLVRREMHGSLPKLLFMSALGGISTATILASINAGMQGTGD